MKELDEKKKGLINIYWFILIIFTVVGLVNLFAIAEDSLEAAAIVDFIFVIFIPLVFVLGYVDYRRFAPLTRIKEIGYCATAVVAMWISLIHFNVQNYNFLSDITGESYYIVGISVLTSLYISVGLICLLLTLMNFHNRKRQSHFYYLTASFSLLSCIFLTAFNYGTYISLFWAPLKLIGINTPIIVETGMTILELRVLIEYCMFIFHANREKKNKTLRKGEESEFRPSIVKMCSVAVFFMIINVVLLPILTAAADVYPHNYTGIMWAHEIIEFISITILFSLGASIAFKSRKSEKFGQIYLRMGIAALIFTLVYLITDFVPIADWLNLDNEVQAYAATNIFRAVVQMSGLLSYTLYVACNKKLNATIRALDKEHDERVSAENYSI